MASTKPPLRKLVLMTWADSNAYESWHWEVFLTERADGTLSTGARQWGTDIPAYRLRGTYRIRTGSALKAAVEDLFRHEVLQDVDWDWPTLLRKIKPFAPSLAAGVVEQILLEEEEERAEEEDYEEYEAFIGPVREWVGRATWPHSTSHGAGGLVSAVANARLRAGVEGYAMAYVTEHGRYPTGEHVIDQAIGDANAAAQAAANQNGVGRAISAPGRVQLTVQFPDA